MFNPLIPTIMKKSLFSLAILLIAAALTSCNKDIIDDTEGVTTKAAYILNSDSRPISNGQIVPVILAVDKPRGGNVSCSDVSEAFSTTFDLCGDKLDFGNFDLDSDLEFNGDFPEWLDVTVTDSKFVSFTLHNSGDVCYKVGAVIVKGSNSANVYFYEDGALSDSGLAAPLNSSGTPAGLSNLTFCFVKCDVPVNLVVAFKSFVTGETFVTSGAYITSYPLVLGGSYPLYWEGYDLDRFLVGHLTITDANADGYWEITADNFVNPIYQFVKPHLYVGTAESFSLDYKNYPYPDPKVIITATNTWTFVLPFKMP